jgi:hypothetical protein
MSEPSKLPLFSVTRVDDGWKTTPMPYGPSTYLQSPWERVLAATDHRAAALQAFKYFDLATGGCHVVTLGQSPEPERPWRLKVKQHHGETKVFMVSKQVVVTYSVEDEVT